jgi:hypothetical protein
VSKRASAVSRVPSRPQALNVLEGDSRCDERSVDDPCAPFGKSACRSDGLRRACPRPPVISADYEDVDAQQRNVVAALDRVIAVAQPLDQPFVAWRVFDSPLVHAHVQRLPGCVVRDRDFVDVTLHEKIARATLRGEHTVLARILLPAGMRVGPLS